MQICEACKDYGTCKLSKRERNDYLAPCNFYRAGRRRFTVEEAKEIIRKAARPAVEREAVTPEIALKAVLEIEKKLQGLEGLEGTKEDVDTHDVAEVVLDILQKRPQRIARNEPRTQTFWEKETGFMKVIERMSNRESFLKSLECSEVSLCMECGRPIPKSRGKKKKIFCGDICGKRYRRKGQANM